MAWPLLGSGGDSDHDLMFIGRRWWASWLERAPEYSDRATGARDLEWRPLGRAPDPHASRR